jgi:serine/threonine-protein kinase
MSIDPAWLGTQFPDLTAIAPIGQGGQKVVFSAIHPTDGEVVLKLINPTHDPENARREVLAVINVQSTRVPKILDQGTVATSFGTSIWLREQRVNGKTLRECLQAGQFDTTKLLKLGPHMLEALVAAEQVHIVHRDVKPENIMCDGNDDFWLLDFGLARHLHLSSLTATAAHWGKGTPGYSPPEQLRNLKPNIDARSDLFALGVTLYECATGANPFIAGTRDALERIRRTETVTLPPLSLSFTAANDFRDLVQTMVQRRFDHRPATAAEAFDWMKEICAKENIT